MVPAAPVSTSFTRSSTPSTRPSTRGIKRQSSPSRGLVALAPQGLQLYAEGGERVRCTGSRAGCRQQRQRPYSDDPAPWREAGSPVRRGTSVG
jgi:hypothetical protein